MDDSDGGKFGVRRKLITYHHSVYNNLNQTHLMKNTLTGKDILHQKGLKEPLGKHG